jgi:hypothetical protein
MVRTVFGVGVMAIIGIVALKLIFGVFGALVGLFFVLLIMAIKIAIFGAIIYFIIRIFSPDSARKIRETISGA